MNLLLFSNSTNAKEDYLSYTLPYIQEFTEGKSLNAVFIPYAGVSILWDEYFEKVNAKLSTIGIRLTAIHQQENALKAIENAELIIVGGGNTFNLLKTLQDNKLLSIIRKQVLSGVPYIAWSAGSNLACPTICTTNDMPIVEPLNFKALNLIPFQINAHYTDATIENHAGETREMRIEEYLIANPDKTVVGLREGTMIEVKNKSIRMQGNTTCRIFKKNKKPKELSPADNFSFLLETTE